MKYTKFLGVAMLAFLAASAIQGKTLSPSEALDRAAAGAPQKVRTALTQSAPKLVSTTMTASKRPAAYLFNNGESGFMLLSADDVAVPVLGYGDSPVDPDNMPPAMEWWLSEYAAELESAGDSGKQYVEWAFASDFCDDWTPIEPLCSTRWNQGAPYNDQCPDDAKGRCVTGCVATAMAQVMKYFNWPAAGHGTHTYIWNSNGTDEELSMDFGAFDWDNMLDTYGRKGSYTDAQGEAVAYLMKACGYSVSMGYSSSGSGAGSGNVAVALRNYFDYDKALYFTDRPYYTTPQWEQMIYDNLKNVGPVYYSGHNPGSGHAFVCDGYSSDHFFHFNWGWGGSSDGYFLLSLLDPSNQGIGGSSSGYSMSQAIILGVRPADAASPSEEPINPMIHSGDVHPVLNGDKLEFRDSFFFNNNPTRYSFHMGMEYVDENGESTFSMNTNTVTLDCNHGYLSMSAPVPSGLADGTYRVYAASQRVGERQPRRMRVPISAIQYCIFTVADGEYSVTELSRNAPRIEDLTFDTRVMLDRNFQLSFKLFNDGDTEIQREIAVGISNRRQPKQPLAKAKPRIIFLQPGESMTLAYINKLEWEENRTPRAGDYNFLIFDNGSKEIYYTCPVTVEENPGPATLSCFNFTIKGRGVPKRVNTRAIEMHLALDCTEGYFNDPLTIHIWKSEGSNSSYVKSIKLTGIEVMAGERYEDDPILDFEEGEIGSEYIMELHYTHAEQGNRVLGQVRFKVTSSESGIEAVDADDPADAAPAEYFDFMGRRVATPQPGQPYIKRTGTEVEKVIAPAF